VAVATVVATYVYIQRRHLPSEGDDVRSGMFVAPADWAATKISVRQVESVRAWKPNLLVPFEDPEQIRGEFGFIADLCRPEGSVKLLGLATEQDVETLQPKVQTLHQNFCHKRIFCTYSIIDSAGFTEGILVGLQALQSAFFRPNLLFLTLPEKAERHAECGQVIVEARRTGVGVLFLGLHPKTGLGQRAVINLWMRAQPERGWDPEAAFENNNLDLTLLTGYRLARFWGAKLNLITVVDDAAQTDDAKAFLEEIIDVARLPETCQPLVMVGDFEQCATDAPQSDIDIMGLQPDPNFAWMLRVIDLTRSSCLFVGDSGHESARA
jgi:hypothetical protein